MLAILKNRFGVAYLKESTKSAHFTCIGTCKIGAGFLDILHARSWKMIFEVVHTVRVCVYMRNFVVDCLVWSEAITGSIIIMI